MIGLIIKDTMHFSKFVDDLFWKLQVNEVPEFISILDEL